jgi:hypothetical protein
MTTGCRYSPRVTPYFAFFQDHAQGLVPLFEVEDAQQATAEPRAAGPTS